MQVDPRLWVLWSDTDLLVVNKPAGLPVLPDGWDPQAPFLKKLLEAAEGRLWTVHRLDRDTSGVLLLARNAEAHRSLNGQFEQRQVGKVYHALVNGTPEWEEKSVKLPLRPNGDRKHRTVVDPRGGKPAHTELRVLERFGGWCLVEARLHTGRTHQIRVHLASVGHPIVADLLYGGGGELRPEAGGEVLIERTALHACSLALSHPQSGAELEFVAPYPEDFARALEWLRSPSNR